MADEKLNQFINEVTKKLIDDGLLIEAGFMSLRHVVIPPDAPEDQVREMRMAFFAGAQHLFGTMMNVLDPDEEPTEADMKRMEHISNELDRFLAEMKLRVGKPKGRA